MNKRESLLKSELKRFIKILQYNYHPQTIIVFGSLGNGIVKKWSDIDMVIVKDTYKPFFDRIKEVLLLLKPKVGVDVMVYNRNEFSDMKKRLFFKEEILKKGKIVYERK